jgi:hypothetical protein
VAYLLVTVIDRQPATGKRGYAMILITARPRHGRPETGCANDHLK